MQVLRRWHGAQATWELSSVSVPPRPRRKKMVAPGTVNEWQPVRGPINPSLIRSGSTKTYGSALRRDVHGESITPLIGVFDMFSASLAAQHYGGMFVSGFGFAASYYGLPDIGFIAWPDMVNFVQRLRLAFPQHHLLVDIDDGCPTNHCGAGCSTRSP